MAVFQNYYFKMSEATPLPHVIYKQKEGGFKLIDRETIENLGE
jgi:hypothetical protein